MSGLLLAETARPTFARHETFHPRFGWLRKAVEHAIADPGVFGRPDAPVLLGVGKNMVNAIRYWGLAFKILQAVPNPDRPRVPLYEPTPFGLQLLGDQGWDPWLEDSGSLWLLHWSLLQAPCTAPVWWVAFHDFAPQQFDEAQLSAQVLQLATAANWDSVLPASVRKDVDCLLRTYTVRQHGRSGLDDVLDCPFRELGLLESAPGCGDYRFVVGEKPSLPDHVVAYAALQFAAQGDARSISVARLSHDPGGPGGAFRLTERALYDALRRVATRFPSLRVAEPGGLRQLLIDTDPAGLAAQILTDYYDEAPTASRGAA